MIDEFVMRHLKTILIVSVLIAILVGLRFLPIGEWIQQLPVIIKSLGPFGPVVFIIGYALMSVFLIPGSAMTLVIGGVYGVWKGLIIVVLGANLGALCAFLLARTFLRRRVSRWAAENPKFASLDRAIGREGFKMVLLSRLSPVFPFTLLNYLLGLTTVKTSSYALANLIGMLPGTFLYVYLGATARDALTGGTGILFRAIGLLATIAVVVLVTRIARKAMAEAQDRTAIAANVQESQ